MPVGHAHGRAARMVNHGHVHRREPLRDRLSDAAHADHADRAVAQRGLAQRIIFLRPLAGTQVALGLRKFAHRAQQESDRCVRHFLGEHIRRVGHRDAVRTRPGGVDMVVADAEGGDDLEPGKSRHERTIDPLLGDGDRHGAHARAALAEELVALLRVGKLDDVERAGEPVHDDALGRTDQENVGFFGGHDSLQNCASALPRGVQHSHQHRHRLLDKPAEGGDQLGAERAVDHAVIAGERHR